MPVWLNLSNTPVRNVDRYAVVLAGIKELLSEESLACNSGDLPDNDLFVRLC